MKKFHLIGQNIQTSLSPSIHNFLFQLKGLQSSKCKYSIYSQQNYLLGLDEMKMQNISGISVTIPFKQSYKGDIVLGKLKNGEIKLRSHKFQHGHRKNDSIIPAQHILSKRNIINTIKLTNSNSEHLQFTSFNTDIFGVKMCFRQNPVISSMIQDGSFSEKTLALIIGGGATAEVFISYFQQIGLKMAVINRSVEKVLKLKEKFYSNILCVTPFNWEFSKSNEEQFFDQQSKQNLIVINTLPTQILKQNLECESQDRTDFLKILLSRSKIKSIFYMDVNYRDADQTLSNLIQQRAKHQLFAKNEIRKISSGLDLLLWQGILQNHIFLEDNLPQNHTLSDQQLNEFSNSYIELTRFLKTTGKVF